MAHKKVGRAWRRHNDARMKAKALRVYPHDPMAKAADHLAVCSCMMCGNPRRRWGSVTMQEMRAGDMTEDDR